MTDKYRDSIEELLEREGALGVNAIQKVLSDIPLSTLQKYLHKQTYFVQNAQRKWDLPISVASLSSKVDNKVIESQIIGINALFEMVTSQMKATVALMGNYSPSAVARPEKQSTVHPKFIELNSKVESALEIYKKYVRVVPEEYQNLLKNLDLYALTINKGILYVNGEFNQEITALLLEKSDNLSDNVLQTLKEYQNNG